MNGWRARLRRLRPRRLGQLATPAGLAALAGIRRRPGRPRLLLALGLAGVLACCCGSFGMVAVFGALGDSAAHSELVACHAAPGEGDPAALDALDDEQRGNGQLIVEVGIDLAVPPRGWVIAVATAAQESSLRNLSHLGEDNDHDSLGLFQQRPSLGWGTPEQIMDPTYASTTFYERLLQVEGWEQLPLTVAAQTVQRSAHPDAYAKHEPLAVAVVNQVAGGAAGAAAAAQELRCAEFGEITAAGWTQPAQGPVWSAFRTANRPDHYGVDIGAARGTPARAAADGVVTLVSCNASLGGQPYSCDVDGSPAVAGCGWYLTIRHGEVLTRYCHLLTRPQVTVGDQVTAGQQLGLVGTSGNSSGPHLHFEVEIHTIVAEDSGGVTVRRAQTDPIAFLAGRGVVLECVSAPVDCQPVHGDRVRTEQR